MVIHFLTYVTMQIGAYVGRKISSLNTTATRGSVVKLPAKLVLNDIELTEKKEKKNYHLSHGTVKLSFKLYSSSEVSSKTPTAFVQQQREDMKKTETKKNLMNK